MNLKNKKRVFFLAAFLVLVALEVLIGLYVHDSFVRPYVGDVLIALVLYTLVRCFLPEKFGYLSICVFLFCTAVEFTQRIPLVDALGIENSFVRTLMGTSYSAWDVLAYAVGCLIALPYDLKLLKGEKEEAKTSGIQTIYLVDFENVNEAGLEGLKKLGAGDAVTIFHSDNTRSMPFDRGIELVKTDAEISFLKTQRAGKNYLDFQLVTYLGYLIGQGFRGKLVIVTKDNGFESVVDFWTSRGFSIVRQPAIVPRENAAEGNREGRSRNRRGRNGKTQEAENREVKVQSAPKQEAPKKEAPKQNAPKQNAPKQNAPKQEAPKQEAPKKEAPKQNAQKQDAPKQNAPKQSAPKSEVKAETSVAKKTETKAVSEAPKAEVPVVLVETKVETPAVEIKSEPVVEEKKPFFTVTKKTVETYVHPGHAEEKKETEPEVKAEITEKVSEVKAEIQKAAPEVKAVIQEAASEVSKEVSESVTEMKQNVSDTAFPVAAETKEAPKKAPKKKASKKSEKTEAVSEAVTDVKSESTESGPALVEDVKVLSENTDTPAEEKKPAKSKKTKKPAAEAEKAPKETKKPAAEAEKKAPKETKKPAEKAKKAAKTEKAASEEVKAEETVAKEEQALSNIVGEVSRAAKEKKNTLPESFRKRVRAAVKEDELSPTLYAQLYRVMQESQNKSELNNTLVKVLGNAKGSSVYGHVKNLYVELNEVK